MRTQKGQEHSSSPGQRTKNGNQNQSRQQTKVPPAFGKHQRRVQPASPSTSAKPKRDTIDNGKRWPEGDLSRDDEAIVRGWAVEHGLERVARIVVALAKTKQGRGYSTQSEALQWMAARHLADRSTDITSLAAEVAVLIHPKPAGRNSLIKRIAASFSAGRLRWVWFEKHRKPPAPVLPLCASQPSPAHERVIHRIVSIFKDDAIDLYKALLQEIGETDTYELFLIRRRKRPTILNLLLKRLQEHKTGAFTPGANRTARTLFDLIAWDLEHPTGEV